MITSVFILVAVAVALIVYLASDSGKILRKHLKPFFKDSLVYVDAVTASDKFDAVYILGGSEKAQAYKFTAAAGIYRQGNTGKLIFMSVDRLTRYDFKLKRNLGFDEWSRLKLENQGVLPSAIEAIELQEGILGTFSEAKGIAAVVCERDYKSILLVASSYHSRRARKSFDYYLWGKGVRLTIVGAEEPVYLKGFVREWLKLKLYEFLMFVDSRMKIPVLGLLAAP
jgi:uncharacterized SAM-binding protein YcdF (DUF218 family)